MTAKEKETIIAYANNDMCLLRAAKELKVDVGTVKYRLKQIALRNKYNPMVFYDLVELLKKVGKL